MIISLDTETTGIDLFHGAKPFLITTCDDEGTIRYWEWDVDPMTRQPQIEEGNLNEIVELIDGAELIYLQNSQFDAKALATLGIQLPWEKVRDTLIAAHLLASNHKRDLTSLVMEYLHQNIEPYELKVKEVVKSCRDIVKKSFPNWRIAREGDESMPSVKDSSDRDEDKPWKNDMWLPRALAKCRDEYDTPPKWLDVCANYANMDSAATLPLGLRMEEMIRERGYWKHYLHRLQLMRADCEMTSYGVSVIGEYTEDTILDYEMYVAEVNNELQSIASGYGHDLQLASGAALNDNMREFFYGSIRQRCTRCKYDKCIKHWNDEEVRLTYCPKCSVKKRNPMNVPLKTTQRDNLNLEVVISEKTGNATLDGATMSHYKSTLEEGEALDFIRLLSDKRKRDTDLMYMKSYRRFWLPIKGAPGYYRIHPSINPCGTDHLRQSSNSPNLQNVGGQEDKCDECDGKDKSCTWCNGTGKTRISIKNCFGPAPGREWWSMDYKSIEARLPAYESGEPKMIEVFEKPNEPPYWGNLYNLTASVLYPDEYSPISHIEGEFRKRYPRLYKQAKFFVLAKNYGAGRRKGDALSGIRNSYDLVDSEFPLLAALQNRCLREAQNTGWVHTIPTRAIDPKRGYPILPSRTEDGDVLSTTPFNYHISGTACECKNLALVRCIDQCAEWRKEGFDAWVSLEIHDEIIFDFPRGRDMEVNLSRASILKGLMEQSGKDLVPSIPTPVKVEYHTQTWARGVS